MFETVQIIPLGFSGRDLEELPLTRSNVDNPRDVARPYLGLGNERAMVLVHPVCADDQDECPPTPRVRLRPDAEG